MSDTDSTFNFVIAMLQSQLFNLLCDKADDEYNGKLPVHVRFLLDEFANIGQIPRFDKLIATIRSREMSASIILQSQSQLKPFTRTRQKSYLIIRQHLVFGRTWKNARIFRITWDGKQLTVSTLPKIAARRFLMDLLIKN